MSGQHFAIEVEQDLLGALMAHAGAIERIEADLQPVHFYRAEHQAIYAAIARLANQGRSCDSLLWSMCSSRPGNSSRPAGLLRSWSWNPRAHHRLTSAGMPRS